MASNTETTKSVWHEGERLLHRAFGLSEQLEAHGPRAIRPFLTDQHRAFFPALPYVGLGTVDDEGAPWGTLLGGPAGFIESPTPRSLQVNALPYANDPAGPGLDNGKSVGLLGIDLSTRRRNRVNGRISARTHSGFSIAVDQTFGNCPRFIHRRTADIAAAEDVHQASVLEDGSTLSDTARRILAHADMFLVASYVDADGYRQVDLSHRGGQPGFVRVEEDGTLHVPDFAGNHYFNTLGNFVANPRAGLLVPDFSTGTVLQLTGTVGFQAGAPDQTLFPGAERVWTVSPTRVVLRSNALPYRWTFEETAPHTPF